MFFGSLQTLSLLCHSVWSAFLALSYWKTSTDCLRSAQTTCALSCMLLYSIYWNTLISCLSLSPATAEFLKDRDPVKMLIALGQVLFCSLPCHSAWYVVGT